MIEMSKFFSDDGTCESVVYKIDNKYKVIAKNDMGTTFAATFDVEQEAENYAEDWVMKCLKF